MADQIDRRPIKKVSKIPQQGALQLQTTNNRQPYSVGTKKASYARADSTIKENAETADSTS
eukprot:970725-Ditylum_brightwellii.AAC.1